MMEMIKKIGNSVASGLTFIQEHFKATVLVLFVLWLILPSGDEGIAPHNLQKIALTGPILDATPIVEQLDEARENEDVKGVLFTIDSPGGAVAPPLLRSLTPSNGSAKLNRSSFMRLGLWQAADTTPPFGEMRSLPTPAV